MTRAIPILSTLALVWQAFGQQAPVAGPPASGLQLVSTETFASNLNYSLPLAKAISGPQLTDGLSAGEATTLSFRSGGEAGSVVSGLSVLYRVSYENNSVDASKGGFSHDARLSWSRRISPRVQIAVSAAASSSTFVSFTDVTGISNTDILSSPLRLTLAGSRRKEAEVGATLTYRAAPRSNWTLRSDFVRELPSGGLNPASGQSGYPGVSAASLGAMYSYRLSPLATVSADMEYSAAFSVLVPNSVGTLSVRYARDLTSGLALYGGAGYSLLITKYDGLAKDSAVPETQGGIQWNRRAWSAQAGATMSAGDSYGLGASSRTNFEFTVRHSGPASPWTFSVSSGYERLRGEAFPLIRNWLLTSSMARRITRQTEVRAEAIWTTEIGSVFNLYPEWNRRGVSISLLWFPNTKI